MLYEVITPEMSVCAFMLCPLFVEVLTCVRGVWLVYVARQSVALVWPWLDIFSCVFLEVAHVASALVLVRDSVGAQQLAGGARGLEGDADVVALARITSYNVCYTKLLRLCRGGGQGKGTQQQAQCEGARRRKCGVGHGEYPWPGSAMTVLLAKVGQQ